jgi:hypothetical protein
VATEDKGRTCSECQAYIPEGVGFDLRANAVLCHSCAVKHSLPSADWKTPHFTVAFLVVVLVVVGWICLLVAVSRSWTAETAAAVTALGGVLWFAVAAGLHLLRRILIALEARK